ncbi:OLC1v1025758C1 [Oldenlandia corymbosa var. corymbosa]|uniref:OLC1v1025758C1 n=1 Tax=Oldenlandia corymbosa var. corymbosa TaxID=529605 RepID=A0AAV1C7V7_OLDCO|nr:OLC1v1025758C1 [Oldenlandia corymbosa var. corymbosa]
MVKKEGKQHEEHEEPKESEIEGEGESVGSVSSGHVVICVHKQNLKDVPMKIKRNIKLGKMMVAYCNHMGLQLDAVRFIFQGQRVREHQTPNDIGLQDGDVIDVWSEQFGGFSAVALKRGRKECRNGALRRLRYQP